MGQHKSSVCCPFFIFIYNGCSQLFDIYIESLYNVLIEDPLFELWYI